MDFKRYEKGLELAKRHAVRKVPITLVEEYEVQGMTDTYTVTYDPRTKEYACNCPDYEYRQQKCKHIIAVQITRDCS